MKNKYLLSIISACVLCTSVFADSKKTHVKSGVAVKEKKEVVVPAKIIGVEYVTSAFLSVHQNGNAYSSTLTTIVCGQAVSIIKPTDAKTEFKYIQIGPYKGYVKSQYLNETRLSCLEKEYPRFYELMNLDVGEIYFWGKLNDMANSGRSKVK